METTLMENQLQHGMGYIGITPGFPSFHSSTGPHSTVCILKRYTLKLISRVGLQIAKPVEFLG